MLLFLCLLFTALPGSFGLPSSGAELLSLHVAEEIVQGNAFAARVRGWNGEMNELAAELLDEAGKIILNAQGFRLPGGEDTWIVLAGVPSTLTPGPYTFKVRARRGAEIAEQVRTITVLSRKFIFEDIPLDQAMSELRADPDPRKDEEARELYRLLGRFDPSAIFHTGPLLLPVERFRETSFYGDRRTYIYSDGGRAKSIHQGTDFATPRGTPVAASGAGRVIMARPRILTGHTVVLEHLPGVFSLYYHLDMIEVQEGTVVKAGDRIGLSGATGLITGPHLHWEVRVAGTAVEPKPLLAPEGILNFTEQ
jgi:murein DD-endopeptidase MepM/ murein hydrolase activator NlpD